jgi:hypothetical protein
MQYFINQVVRLLAHREQQLLVVAGILHLLL